MNQPFNIQYMAQSIEIIRGIRNIFSISLVWCTCAAGLPTSPLDTSECVILLHGLGRTSRAMQPLACFLERQGYRIVNLGYPSTEKPIDKLTELVREKIEQSEVRQAARLHFVTHSLGGIVVRSYLNKNRPPNLGRVVMLGPPNHGSELVDTFSGTCLFRKIYGPAAMELGTCPESSPNRLGPVNFELGVIAGNRSVNPFFSRLIPGEDDGKVSVESAKVEGMVDFLVVPHSHPFLMNSSDVAEQVVYFLKQGRFNK